MTKSTITREQITSWMNDANYALEEPLNADDAAAARAILAMGHELLAAMDSESECLPLDYLQGHKDGLEWAARLAEANHHETGDWLYDDPIELAKAIRKGPDMPPAQPVADREPDRNPVLAYADSYRDMAKQGVESVPIWSVITDLERNIAPLYRHAQPVPVVPYDFDFDRFNDVVWLECVASNPHMHSPTTSIIARVALELNKRILAGNSPVITDGWTCNDKANAALMMLDRIETVDPVDDDRIDGIKRIVRELATAPHDTPALNSVQSVDSVADRWIPVSERMPENDGAYLCWDNRYVTTYAFIFGAWQANQFIAKNITHWMPLPAGPQGVKGE